MLRHCRLAFVAISYRPVWATMTPDEPRHLDHEHVRTARPSRTASPPDVGRTGIGRLPVIVQACLSLHGRWAPPAMENRPRISIASQPPNVLPAAIARLRTAKLIDRNLLDWLHAFSASPKRSGSLCRRTG